MVPVWRHSASSSEVIRKPLNTKKRSTPSQAPIRKRFQSCEMSTRRMAMPRTPSSAGRCQPSAPPLMLDVTGDRGDYSERGSTLQRGDTAYLHNYDTGAVGEMHVSKVVGLVAYNDLQWLSDQASAPTLTL